MEPFTPARFRTLAFSEAARCWLEIKELHTRKARTIEMYRWYIRNLEKAFGALRWRRSISATFWITRERGAGK